ncbi:MAG: rod shape-determining protein MreD [Eubacterium sp.]|nr:rod shape-determining protein MreD [Eubacterium sp.]
MELTKKKRTIKYAVYGAVLLLAALLQNTGGLFPEIGRARCFLLIPVCIILGINEDERVAAFIGLFGGFLWDAVCAQHMGFNCIFLMFACYFASALVSYVFRNTFVTGLIASVTAIVVYCLLYWLLFVLMSRPEGAGFALGRFYVPCALYSIALAPVIEAVLIPLKSKVTGERQLDA